MATRHRFELMPNDWMFPYHTTISGVSNCFYPPFLSSSFMMFLDGVALVVVHFIPCAEIIWLSPYHNDKKTDTCEFYRLRLMEFEIFYLNILQQLQNISNVLPLEILTRIYVLFVSTQLRIQRASKRPWGYVCKCTS